MTSSKENEEKQQKSINEAIKKLDTSDFIFHKLAPEETVARLHTNLQNGLSTDEAEKRVKVHGLNELDKEKETSLLERILE